MDEVSATLLAAALAAVLAAIGINRQARAEERSARLALFKERLDVYIRVEKLVFRLARSVDGLEGGAGSSVVRIEDLVSDLELVVDILPHISFLFGTDTVVYVDEVIGMGERVITPQIRLTTEEGESAACEREELVRAVVSMAPELDALGGRLLDVFEPYLGNDRTVGVPASHRRKLAQEAGRSKRDPALRPTSPYIPGSPE